MRRHRAVRVALGATLLLTITLVVSLPVQAAARCFGRQATIVGTNDVDTINGTGGADVIVTGEGADRINGRGGNDLICSGRGRDRVRGQAGSDRINGGTSGDVLLAGEGNDVVVGGQGAEFVAGANGNDSMKMGTGADFMIGGAGNDRYLGGPSLQDIASFENSGAGVVVDLGLPTAQNTNEGTDVITGTEGVIGSAYDDRLTGLNIASEFGDLLAGLEGTDQLVGLDGNDFIVGGLGSDKGAPAPGSLSGGFGNDIVVGDEPEAFLEGAGDDDLFGDAGDDFLDGGGNVSGPPAGDVGNGGTHVVGDECTGLETATECERFLRDTRTTFAMAAAQLAVEDHMEWWMGAARGRVGSSG
ncbi:MAG TPA: calcium-binding protein [Actinomycetota bacterium]|nr:calcium-binding protein [Actinomycetota bacterium]